MAQYDGSIRIGTRIDTKSVQVQLQSLENQIVKATDKIASLRSKMDTLKDAKIPTKEYEKLQTELEKTSAKYEELKDTVETFQKNGTDKDFAPFRQARDEAQELYMKIEDIRGEMFELEESGKAFTLGSETEEFSKLRQQLQYAENEMSVLNQKHDLLELKQKKASDGYKKLGDTAKKSIEKINKTQKKSNNLLGTMGSRLKSLLLSFFIFNQISKIFRAMSNAVKEGFENIYNENNRFKSSVDSLKASAETLKNTLAAAFLPLVEVAIPYIQQFIGWLTKALDLFAQFMAALTGQKTYTKALKQTAEATEDAKEKTEGYLSPLDEINKIQKNETDGKEEENKNPSFEEVQIDSKVLDAVERLKNALAPILEYAKELKDIFMQGFMEGLGDYQPRLDSIRQSLAAIKDSLIDIFTDSDVLSAADSWAKSVARLLGTFAGSVASIGLTIAANLIGGIAKYLEQNKSQIKEYLISMFNIWEEINNMLSDFFTSFAYVFEAFASENGQHLTANILGIFSSAFMGVTELASKIIRDIAQIFIKPFVDSKEAFREALEGFLGVLSEVTSTIKQGVDDTFAKFNEVYDKHLKPFFDSVAQGLSEIVEKVLSFWNENVQPVLEGMAEKFDILWKEHVQPFLNKSIELLGSVADLLKALWENVLKPLIDWIVDNVLPVVLPILESIYNHVVSVLGSIFDIFASFKEMLKGVIDFLTGVFTGDWDKAFDGLTTIVTGAMNGIKGVIELVLNAISGFVKTSLNTVKAVFSTVFNGIKSLVSTIFNAIKSTISSILTSIHGANERSLNKIKETWSNILSSIKNTVVSIFNGIWETISGVIGKISSAIKGLFSLFDQTNEKSSGIFGASNAGVSLLSASNPAVASLASVDIPGYATGQVIPRTMKKHLAILGDNNKETEVVSPLSTIEKAVENVLSRNGGNKEITIKIPIYFDGNLMYEKVITIGKERQMSSGNNDFLLGMA